MSVKNEVKKTNEQKNKIPEIKEIKKEIKAEDISNKVKNFDYVKEVTNFGTIKRTAEQKKKAAEMIEAARKADSKLVKGIFKNLECQGGDLSFAYHAYKGEPTRVYHLIDGHEYEIPVGVAKHINRQCKYKRSKHLVNKDGTKMIVDDKPIERYQFVSTDYM